MAKGSVMLQVDVEQVIDQHVSYVPAIVVQAFELLSFGKTTVREISAEKLGGIIAGASASFAGYASTPFAVLRLFLKGGEEVFFLAPSHVPSPQFEAGAAILEIRDGGARAIGDTELQVARRIGGHAYLDEIP
jgi:hypothetical protein